MVHLKEQQQGFALLMAIIVVSVVISISLTVLDLTTKQLRLSTNSKDSEVAFHTTNATLECARYWRVASSNEIESEGDILPTCFGVSAGTVNKTTIANMTSSGKAYQYKFDFTWISSGITRCSKINIVTLVSDIDTDTTLTNMATLIPGYPYGTSKTCGPGGRCSVISAQGYNRSCSDISNVGTVQREVLLEL